MPLVCYFRIFYFLLCMLTPQPALKYDAKRTLAQKTLARTMNRMLGKFLFTDVPKSGLTLPQHASLG